MEGQTTKLPMMQQSSLLQTRQTRQEDLLIPGRASCKSQRSSLVMMTRRRESCMARIHPFHHMDQIHLSLATPCRLFHLPQSQHLVATVGFLPLREDRILVASFQLVKAS